MPLTDIKYILPVDNVIAKLPDYQSFGRKTKLRLNLDRIPNLHWNLSTTLNTTPTLKNTTIRYADKYGFHLVMHEGFGIK